jgi:hypothetical protein
MSDILLERTSLPQGRRLRGGLLDSAETLPEGWQDGIRFRTIGCSPPEILGLCEVGDPEDMRPSSATFRPTFIRQNAACALMSQVGTTDLALNRSEATVEWGLGQILATGEGTAIGAGDPNPSFADADLVHIVNVPDGNLVLQAVDAVSCLEQAVADTGYGAAAVLHSSFRGAAYLRSGHLNVDGYSPAGLPWIISPGYPEGPDVGDGTTVMFWATGPVWIGVEDGYVLIDPQTGQRPVNWQTNLDAAYVNRLAIAAFDPCLNLAASFVAPACNGDS